MSKATKLTVHVNTVEKRRKREFAKDVSREAEAVIRENDIRAYAFVGISSDGKAYALWDTGKILPRWAFADTIATILRSDVSACQDEDDWRPTLSRIP